MFLSCELFLLWCFFLFFLDKEDVTEVSTQQQVKDNTVRTSPESIIHFSTIYCPNYGVGDRVTISPSKTINSKPYISDASNDSQHGYKLIDTQSVLQTTKPHSVL